MKSIALTLFIIPLLLTRDIEQGNANTDPIVLELFTSQGCSSCPPADKLLNNIKNDKVFVLSYHVDYWNYIGWKDPFSKSAYSNKQREYAVKFNSSTIYTPQLVINGREHIVGSDKVLLSSKISQYSNQNTEQKVSLSNVTKSERFVKFNYQISGILDDKYIRAVLVINERKTSVKRGENRNKELVNTNIVVNEQRYKLTEDSGEGSILIPEIVNAKDDLSLILIIENDALDITGADQKSI